MKNIHEMIHKMTLTISVPLDLFVWLKQTQRNCSAYVTQAVIEKREREEEAQAQETT